MRRKLLTVFCIHGCKCSLSEVVKFRYWLLAEKVYTVVKRQFHSSFAVDFYDFMNTDEFVTGNFRVIRGYLHTAYSNRLGQNWIHLIIIIIKIIYIAQSR